MQLLSFCAKTAQAESITEKTEASIADLVSMACRLFDQSLRLSGCFLWVYWTYCVRKLKHMCVYFGIVLIVKIPLLLLPETATVSDSSIFGWNKWITFSLPPPLLSPPAFSLPFLLLILFWNITTTKAEKKLTQLTTISHKVLPWKRSI